MKMSPKRLFLILVSLVVILGATTFYFYWQSRGANNGSVVAAQEEAKALSAKVGKLILLPTDEIPTIATVSDPEVLRDQAFFMDAKKGDKVLIYTNAKKAVLYDPVANKIVNVAPLNTSDQKPASSAVTAPSTSSPASSTNKDEF